MTFSTEKHESPESAWQQLERLADSLHELARAPIDPAAFYRRLLEDCVTTLAAGGGAVWRRESSARWDTVHQVNLDAVIHRDDSDLQAAHQQLLDSAAQADETAVYPPLSGAAGDVVNATNTLILAGPVPREEGQAIVIELFLPGGRSPAVQQGWRELLDTVCQIAADYHTWDEFRHLRTERAFFTQALTLLRRVHGRADLRRTAFEIANEGCRLVGADRLSILVSRRRTWRLVAVSGVERIEARADAAKSLEQVADWTGRWGEPIDYADGSAFDDLPTELADLLQLHVDRSQARYLVAVPLELIEESDIDPSPRASTARPSAMLIAEQFQTETTRLSREQVIELAHLCQPALGQAMRLDRFPLRSVLRWSDRWARLGWFTRFSRLAVTMLAVFALAFALVFVKRDFEIEAPARLTSIVERDVFATTDGTVAELRVNHGDQVGTGEVLAMLDDPQLLLDLQRVRGEMDTTDRRLEAIAVARTDRKVREDAGSESLSLSAEAQQLQQRMASLRRQEEILIERREALSIRSPIAGTVLTIDVQHLLESRPVARGQVLLTVADTTAGWRLLADVPQRQIGHVVGARRSQPQAPPVRFRLAGDVEHTYTGHIKSIRETAVLDTDNLDGEPPTIEVEVAIDDRELAAARPGMNAQVRIYCGRRSLGYVWLHDVWETIYGWVVF